MTVLGGAAVVTGAAVVRGGALRPLRMPPFKLSDDQLTALQHYIRQQAEQAMGRTIIAEMPAGEDLVLFSEDATSFHYGDLIIAKLSAAIQAAIREAQQLVPGYTYVGFSRKVMQAGCAGYIVSFPGRRAVYFGRTAETGLDHAGNAAVARQLAALMKKLPAGYRIAADLRSTNERWIGGKKEMRDTGIYCGPGLWFNRDTGRIHIRLAHHQLEGLGSHAYRGETDPRKLARRLWNVDELGARYEAFVERIRARTGLAGFLMTADAAFE